MPKIARPFSLLLAFCLFCRLACADAPAPSVLLRGGTVVDGSGARPRRADVRLAGDAIAAVGKLAPLPGETVIDVTGLTVAPGFIDAHSHADGGIDDNPTAENQVRQGITTAIIGQDGFSHVPLADYIAQRKKVPTALNFASFVGHNSLRSEVLGKDFKRAATPDEIAKLAALADREMQAGALGLSSGLEYDPGNYAATEEVVACARVAAKYKGIYISHVRDEENEAVASFEELLRVAREGGLPAQISHIKLASSNVWGKSKNVLRLIAEARRQGLDITADIYPYTYWRSTITVITPTRDWNDRAAWQKGLDEVGGPGNVLLTPYTPDSNWAGKTIAEIATLTGKDAVTVIQEIVAKTHAEGSTEREGVIVTAMRDDDVTRFIQSPLVMFCTDGGLRSSHPRGSGSYPRVLGVYVRQKRALRLEEAIRKMTSFPAARFGLKDRGLVRAGMKADLVIFNARTVEDKATVTAPAAAPVGIEHVYVNGVAVLAAGKITGALPGITITRAQ